MLTFLFWNLNRKDLTASIDSLVNIHNIDILILAECEISPANLLRVLNPSDREAQFHYSRGECEKIQIFTRFPDTFSRPIFESSRFTMRCLTLPGFDEILLVAAHLLSLTNADQKTLDAEALEFAREIRQIETERGHSRTILVGDLNMNPFADGMVAASGLHGVMTKEIAKQEARTIQTRGYLFFYNPMWRHFGDRPDKPPGSYYYRGSDHVCYFWNIFDQVLIRPALLDYWDDEDLQILTDDGVTCFLSERIAAPNQNQFSDHLPILFCLNF